MFVLTIDQQRSRTAPDAVPDLLSALAEVDAVVPFARTIGDEVQGVVESPEDLVAAVLRASHPAQWSIGIGAGSVETPLPPHSRDARGAAFVRARAAVEAAKGELVPLVLEGQPETARAPSITGVEAQTALRLLVHLVGECTEVQWAVVSAVLDEPGITQHVLAERLDVSQQFVSKTLRVTAAELIASTRDLAIALLTIWGTPEGSADE